METKKWFCDHCGQIIQDAKQGWLEWIVPKDGNTSGYRIVHHQGFTPGYSCYYNEEEYHKNGFLIYGIHLDRFVGTIGMAKFLALFEETPIFPKKEFLFIFRRLYIPYYEEALQYWHQAENDGYFDDLGVINIYNEIFLKQIVDHYKNLD